MVATSVHAQVLGPSFQQLPPLLRGVHDGRRRREFSGRCSIASGRNWLARGIALFASLPRRSHEDVAIHVVIERVDGSETSELRETWTRRFGEQRMQSVIRPGSDGLEECFGPMVLTFGLTAESLTASCGDSRACDSCSCLCRQHGLPPAARSRRSSTGVTASTHAPGSQASACSCITRAG
jgi:hypothetical protein